VICDVHHRGRAVGVALLELQQELALDEGLLVKALLVANHLDAVSWFVFQSKHLSTYPNDPLPSTPKIS